MPVLAPVTRMGRWNRISDIVGAPLDVRWLIWLLT